MEFLNPKRDHKLRSILQRWVPCNFQYHWCPKGCDGNRWQSVTFAQSSQRQGECWHVAFNKIKIRNNFTSRKTTQRSLLAQDVLVLLWQGHSRTLRSFRQLFADILTYYSLWELEKEHGRKRATRTGPGKLMQSIPCALTVELTARSAVNLLVFLWVNINCLNWDVVPESSDFCLSDNSSFCSAMLYFSSQVYSFHESL